MLASLLSFLLLLVAPVGAAEKPSQEDWDLALGAKKEQDYKAELFTKAFKVAKTQALQQLVSSARSWIDEEFDDLPEEGRSEITKKMFDYLYDNQGDIDGAVRNMIDGKRDDSMATIGTLFGKAAQAACEIGDPGEGGLADSPWTAGQNMEQLMEPVAQLSSGLGRMVEGDYRGAGEEFAKAIPGVKKVHDTVKYVADKERELFHGLLDESYGEVYRRWKDQDSTKDLQETKLLFDASNSKGLLDQLKRRYGWKDDRVALRRIDNIFRTRFQAEQAAEEEYETSKRIFERADRLDLIVLPEPLPPEGEARTKALRDAFRTYRHRTRTLRDRLAREAGIPVDKVDYLDMISMLPARANHERAVRSGDEADRALHAKRFEELRKKFTGDRRKEQAEELRRRLAEKAQAEERGADAASEEAAAPLGAAGDGARAAFDCEDIPEAAVQEIENRLLRSQHSEVVSLATRLAGREERGGFLDCICRAHSTAAPTVSVYFTSGKDDCGDPADGPCVNSGWGCWRSAFVADAEAIRSCGLASKVAKRICEGSR